MQLNACNREELNPPEVLVHLLVTELLNLLLREKRINEIRITQKKKGNNEKNCKQEIHVTTTTFNCTWASPREEGVISNLHSGICKELTGQPYSLWKKNKSNHNLQPIKGIGKLTKKTYSLLAVTPQKWCKRNSKLFLSSFNTFEAWRLERKCTFALKYKKKHKTVKNTLQTRKGAFWGEGKGGLKSNLKNRAKYLYRKNNFLIYHWT